MKIIPAGEFKARCLKIMDDVQSTREPVVITKKGRPVVKLVAAGEAPGDPLGVLADVMKIVGDVTQPIEDPETWESLR